MYVQVAVPGPFLTPLTYRYSVAEVGEPAIGGRVSLPFRQKKLIGLVIDKSATAGCDEAKVKDIVSVLDVQPIFSNLELTFLKWASFYYHEPIGNVMQTALPKRLRMGEDSSAEGVVAWQLKAGWQALPAVSARAKQQQAILEYFQQKAIPLTAEVLNQQFSHWRTPLKRLVEQNWLEEVEQSCLKQTLIEARPGYFLNENQQKVVEQVWQACQQKTFAPFLLEGVTGSGKTETYLGVIEKVIATGKQVLILVPEIGLTPQTVERFERFLQQPIAVMHSGLNDKERHCAWSLARENKVSVLLGTRSAIFSPFADLGLCIMDEEHDLSFKQQDGFRYSARDCLVRRAQLEKVPVILGSATPSLESLHNAKAGRYQHLKLAQRAGGAELPSVQLVDVRGEKMAEGVSVEVKRQMALHLEKGNQVLLFLNRRGYSPVLMCHDCGWQAACPSCDANMTYHHHYEELRCHHCGYQLKAPKHCPECNSEEFVPVGQGTQRLEALMQSWFPESPILRVDRDTTRLKGSIHQLTQQAKSGEAKILIGTQMLAKGHDFPQVTLVVLLDIDQGLFSPDFRAAERMAQLIVQVSGRAGRGALKGEVLIQTHQPEHPLMKTLVKSGYHAFAEAALAGRTTACLPPLSYQILLRAEAVDAQQAWQFLNEAKQLLLTYQQNYLTESAADLLAMGPVSAPMVRRQGRYRFQLLLQSRERGKLHQWLGGVESQLYASKLARQVRWHLDIDPQEMG